MRLYTELGPNFSQNTSQMFQFFKTIKSEFHFLWMIGLISTTVYPQVSYNHPELDWQTFETPHFLIHFTPETERTAREGAFVAESIYPHVTKVYDYEPRTKTHLIFLDTDDYSNGITYYYDNKIEIWASPLDFELRGSHRWLQGVITHEFVHIISLQKSFKFGNNIPGAYIQWIGYEKETREDVLYGYPNTLISYPIPGATVPPWLAEGVAQYMYEGATHDFWDTHRDMILRDHVIHGHLHTLNEMNTFGKSGIGNESTYNAGFALVRYIVFKYGESSLKKILTNLSNPFRYSVDRAIKMAIGLSGNQVYHEFKNTLEARYEKLLASIKEEFKGTILLDNGTTNIHPVWAPDSRRFAYLSNNKNDYFSQTDLYIYDLDSDKSEMITEGVISAATWKSTGEIIYYCKRSKPDKHGSKWFDLYEYNFEKDKEIRLTHGSRAFSPVLLPGDSLLVYLAVRDGTHNVVLINLISKESEQITDFENGKQIFSLAYDQKNNWLLFDYVENHFRNTAFLSLTDTTLGNYMATMEWDERDITTSDGITVFSNDKTGIFNLYFVNESTGEQGYITNVIGGAFMSDVNSDGQIIYSLYEDGGYKIALIDTFTLISEEVVGYSPNYFKKFAHLPEQTDSQDGSEAKNYHDLFSSMFIFPKIMMDYGTVKPGFYFYSSEILNKLNIFGGASTNSIFDVDLFLLFEFRKFYPTLFSEIFYITRNISESTKYRDVYNLDYDIQFRLFQWDVGLKVPIRGVHELKLYGSYQKFHENFKERIEGQFGKVGLDYYIGKHLGISWNTHIVKRTVDADINPGHGFNLFFDGKYEKNKFFEGFKINEKYSTPQEVFTPFEFWRLSANVDYHYTIPRTPRWTASFGIRSGWMSETEVDSFFNFFGGGLPGIKGYPYYSIEGNRLAQGNFTLRIPIMMEKHIPFGPFILQNVVVGLVGQYGDAWNGNGGKFDGKKSVGLQFRFGGFSFYNYPTGIAVEVHKGLDKFSTAETSFGEEIRTYFTILFGF